MEPTKKSHGALIGSIIIIIILIIGGIYFWQSKTKDLETKKQLQAEAINSLTQEELNQIEQELNTVDLELNIDIDNLK